MWQGSPLWIFVPMLKQGKCKMLKDVILNSNIRGIVSTDKNLENH